MGLPSINMAAHAIAVEAMGRCRRAAAAL